jgi:hypothetical protein
VEEAVRFCEYDVVDLDSEVARAANIARRVVVLTIHKDSARIEGEEIATVAALDDRDVKSDYLPDVSLKGAALVSR